MKCYDMIWYGYVYSADWGEGVRGRGRGRWVSLETKLRLMAPLVGRAKLGSTHHTWERERERGSSHWGKWEENGYWLAQAAWHRLTIPSFKVWERERVWGLPSRPDRVDWKRLSLMVIVLGNGGCLFYFVFSLWLQLALEHLAVDKSNCDGPRGWKLKTLGNLTWVTSNRADNSVLLLFFTSNLSPIEVWAKNSWDLPVKIQPSA